MSGNDDWYSDIHSRITSMDFPPDQVECIKARLMVAQLEVTAAQLKTMKALDGKLDRIADALEAMELRYRHR